MFALAVLSGRLLLGDCPSTSAEIRWPMPDGRIIAGTLQRPVGADTTPVAVYISGAGPQHRHYHTVTPAKTSVYRVLQDRLLCAGVGSLVFDEVGTGASTGSYAEIATTETLANDVTAIVHRLAQALRVGRVHLVGHSEGGAIAAMVAAREPSVASVVLLAAPAHRGRDVIEYQYTSHNKLYGIAIEQLKARHEQRLASDRWYQFFLTFDPSPSYARIRSPVLILHGEQDTDVTPLQADSILTLVRSARQTTAQCIRYSDTDHTFTDMEHSEWLPHLASIEEIVRFLRSPDAQARNRTRCERR